MNVTHQYLLGDGTPKVFAHRGLVTPEDTSRGIVENTRTAFQAAVDAGCRYLESDCRMTRDGVVVMFHDENLQRVTGDPRRVAEITHADMHELLAERGGLLTLDEFLSGFTETRLNIDVKSREAAVRAGETIGPHGGRVLLTSFDDRTRSIALAAAGASGVRPATAPGRSGMLKMLCAVSSRVRSWQAGALRGIDALQIPERYRGVPVLGDRLIHAAHAVGVEVHVWTVNEVADMRRLLDLGVDGIITDRADEALNLVEQW